MINNFATALQHVLKSEGGFQADPRDRGNANGGMTNLGVTKATWEEWVGYPVSEKTMRELTPAQVAPMYRRRYWERINGDALPAGIDYACFDAAVNSGPGRAIKWLQGCVGVDVDGSLGPKTLAAVKAFNQEQLITDYSKRRLSYLTELNTWPTFGKGWTRRVMEVEQTALNMI